MKVTCRIFAGSAAIASCAGGNRNAAKAKYAGSLRLLLTVESIIGTMGFLSGKKILITGLLSNRSIAYGIAKAARREGAELAFTYQNERFKERVIDMARELGSGIALPCEGTSDAEIDGLFKELKKQC